MGKNRRAKNYRNTPRQPQLSWRSDSAERASIEWRWVNLVQAYLFFLRKQRAWFRWPDFVRRYWDLWIECTLVVPARFELQDILGRKLGGAIGFSEPPPGLTEADFDDEIYFDHDAVYIFGEPELSPLAEVPLFPILKTIYGLVDAPALEDSTTVFEDVLLPTASFRVIALH